MDILYDILTINDELCVLRGAEGGVEDCAVFCFIDVDAREHGFDGIPKFRFLRKLEQEADCLVRNAVLGIIKIEIILELNDIA